LERNSIPTAQELLSSGRLTSALKSSHLGVGGEGCKGPGGKETPGNWDLQPEIPETSPISGDI